MQEENFIVREPLLNAQERVLGYELLWQRHTGGARPDVESILSLAQFAAEQLNDTESGALLGEQLLFLEVIPGLLADPTICSLPVKGTVLALRAADLGTPEAVEALKGAKALGYSISVREVDLPTFDRALVQYVNYFEVPVTAGDFAAQVQAYRGFSNPAVRLVARKVSSWQAYDVCATLNLFCFVGKLHLTPRSGNRARELNPAQAMILQLMDMVRQNADVKQLENVLKRDAALSYKLLRYINSAGFGLGCEIQSLKHAVTMLGYSPLYRWLALLLATATTTGYSPVLMQTAVIRGRFAELLGHAFLPKNEAENLFVAGMFSLLDKLLGVPMEDVLEKIQLSESVTQALLTREGIYGPFLALAEACELNSPEVEAMATSLCIGAEQVNEAHMAALGWAQTVKL
ncbi:HDOD domain-containing protein [Oxalobacteraceae bacterium OM1]|nr:HDOD domain-containing protein [Oxalobacteraceae bacterium OM1]